MANVSVTLHTLNGEALEVELEPDSTALELKDHVSSTWQIPHMCQKIMFEKAVLADSDVISDHCVGNRQSISLTVAIDMSSVVQGLSGPGDLFIRSLRIIQNMSSQYDCRAAIPALLACLRNGNAHSIQRLTAKVLEKVAGKGDEETIDALFTLLDEGDSWYVKMRAAKVISKIGVGSNDGFLLRVLDRLRSKNGDTRLASMVILYNIVKPKHHDAIAAIRPYCDDRDSQLKNLAVKILSTVEDIGDESDLPHLPASLDREVIGNKRQRQI